MNNSEITDKDSSKLNSVLDSVVNEALRLNLSESQTVSRLLERFQLLTATCRSAVHIENKHS